MRPALLLACLIGVAACRPAGGEGAPEGGAPPAEPPWPGLTLDIVPDAEREEVGVEVRVGGDRAASLKRVTVARAWADTRGAEMVWGARAWDAEGEVLLQPQRDDGGPDDVYLLSRAPAGGDFVLRYRARANAGKSRFALRVAPNRLSGVGHAFLMLPRLEEPGPVRVRIHAGALRRGADAASSFGFGEEVVSTAASEDLAHAVYVAGMLWREGGTGDTGESLLVLGDPPFDTRKAWDRAVAAREAVDRFFRSAPRAAPGPFTFVMVAEAGLGKMHDGAFLTRSVGVWMDAAQPLDGELDLTIAHELTHRFLGGTVRLVGRDGQEARWFSEGFAVHFARRVLLQAGLISPADFVADVDRSLAEPGSGDHLPAEYRRGAAHAAWLDAAIRRASRGRRSLDDVVRALVAQARSWNGGNVPISVLRDALAKEIGADGPAHVDRLEARDDTPLELPDDAFGPCARRVVRERRTFLLGFDRRSLDLRPALIRGLAPGSEAERAGVHEGALVLRSRVPTEAAALSARAEVELILANGRRVHYRPVETKRETRWETAPCKSGVTAPGR